MPMSATEKAIFQALVPFATAEFQSVVAPIVKAKLVSASPELNAAEKDLAAFIIAVIPDVLASLV
jgi:hypothetical protein